MIESVYIHIPFCHKICSYCDFAKLYYKKEVYIFIYASYASFFDNLIKFYFIIQINKLQSNEILFLIYKRNEIQNAYISF